MGETSPIGMAMPRRRAPHSPAAVLTQRGAAIAVLAILLVLVFVGLAPPALSAASNAAIGTAQSGAGDLPKQILYIAIFLATIGLAARERTGAWRYLPTAAILLMMGWCWLSLGWAAFPDIAVRRVALMTIVILTTFLLVHLVGVRTALATVSWVLLAVLVTDYAAVLTLPNALQATNEFDWFSDASGSWRGLHTDKNAAGVIVALGIVFYLFRLIDASGGVARKLPWAAAVLLGAVFLYKTGSKTSLALVPVSALLGGGMVLLGRSRWAPGIVFGGLGLAIASLLILDPDIWRTILERWATMMNDPAALTGRVQIWPVLFDYSSDHFWLGSGYGSFWAVGDTGPMWINGETWLTIIPNAHNGYIDLLVQTGMIGLVLTVVATLVLPLATLATRPDIAWRVRWLAGTAILFVLLHNFLETSLFDRDQPAWVLTLVILACLAQYRETRALPKAIAARRVRRSLSP